MFLIIMKPRKIIIVYVLIIAILLFSGALYYYRTQNDEDIISSNEELECMGVGGEWKTFTNGCVDSCLKERSEEPVFCTQALTDGCDCGSDRCWNGKSCEGN